MDDGRWRLQYIPCKCQWEPEAISSHPFGVPYDDARHFSVQNPVSQTGLVNNVREE